MENQARHAIDDLADQEALRLTLAFYCIMEPEKRDQVLALAQHYAALSAKVALLNCLDEPESKLP